jgi:hypothetical protein
MPLDPWFAGSNPTDDNGFLRAIKISSRPSFGEKVKLPAPCGNILQHVKETFGV